MFLKNFFGEALEVASNESLENAVEDKYGLPKSHQRIFEINGQVFVSLDPFKNESDKLKLTEHQHQQNEESKTEVVYEVPDDLKELGVEQQDYQCLYELYHDNNIVREKLLPFTFNSFHSRVVFNNIDKSKLSSVDQYIESMTDIEKEFILKSVEHYIDSFINFS
ncbi:uncharacterized protein VICG_00468 [Vittaforma corneae ATCC 50505]|uniref:Uncharacterized protein n=1 Tax=Vittaforma corneae (strain ATCC 50505) TaxID=993615 RepID=L2GPC8_VITCO|nr:uncharacterized protein VICG_00468 [Vittaforma corneae ATCC 50505]ELA42370.1 hypothetical protein VICG_00468 [Vittaforma corneae ATCC 50505]